MSASSRPRRGPSLTTGLLTAMIGLAFVLPPGFESPIPTCFGYWWTGIPCPLCGMSRAMIHAAHGQFGDALRFHPAVLTIFPALAMGLIASIRRDITGKDPGSAWRSVTNVVGWASLLFIIGFGAARVIGVVLLGLEPW